MKRFCFAFVLIVFSFVLLSCQNHATDSPSRGNEEETDPDNTHGDHTKKSKPDKDHDPTQSQDPTPAYGELAGEENLAFFYNAMEIYSWKAMGVTGFELDYSKKTTGGDTVIYTKVAGGAYDTMEKVDTLLKIYFSDPLCAEIKDGLFWETDGALYVVDAARGSDITIVGETLYLTRETDSTRTYTMVVERDEDMNGETNTLSSYVYEAQNINGTWRFTVFPFYW